MKLTYLKLEKGVAMLSGKLYECEVLGTFYENGKPSAKIRVSKNGKEVDLFCDMTSIYPDVNAYTKNTTSIEQLASNKGYLMQGHVRFPFKVNEEENEKVELLVDCWIADPAQGAKQIQIRVSTFMTNPWGCYFHTDQIPAGVYTSKQDLIRSIGVAKVDNEGNESIFGGAVEKIQLTDAQNKAIKALELALKGCEKANVKLVYAYDTAHLHAFNGNIPASVTYCDDEDTTDYNFVNAIECQEVQTEMSIPQMCEDDVIIVK